MPEEIGSVGVGIYGDYSQLLSDFQTVNSAAEQAGKDIAQSFSTAAEGEQALEAAFQRLIDVGFTYEEALGQMQAASDAAGYSSAAAAGQLSLFGDAAEAIPFAEVNGQLNLFATELETFGGAASSAAQDTDTLNNSFNTFSDAAQGVIDREDAMQNATAQAASTLSELYRGFQEGTVSAGTLERAQDELAKTQEKVAETGHAAGISIEGIIEAGTKLFGLKLGIDLLKELATNAIEVAADQERLVESLTALGGSAQAAAEKMELIEKISFKNALDIDTVEKVTQRMTAFGLSTDETKKALQAAADASRATGTSFESAATKIENMVKSGMAGSRQLVQLGLDTSDLGTVMGKTGSQVAAAFKQMDESDRLNVIREALQKFKGIGEQTADDLIGKWQNLKNDFHNLMESTGGDLSVLAKNLVEFADSALKEVSSTLGQIKTTAHELTEVLSPVASALVDVAKSIGGIVGIAAPITGKGGLGAWLVGSVTDYIGMTFATTELHNIALALQAITGNTPQIEEMKKAADEALKIFIDKGPLAKQGADAVKASVEALARSQEGFGNVSAGTVTAIDNIVKASATSAFAFSDEKTAYDKVLASYQHGTALYKDHALVLADGTKIEKEHVATLEDVTIALQKVTAAAGAFANPGEAATLAMANMGLAARTATRDYEASRIVYEQLLRAFNSGTATYAQMSEAYNKMAAAENAAAAAGVPIPGTLEAISLAAKEAATGVGALATSAQIVAAQMGAQADATTLLQNKSIEAGQKLVLLQKAQEDLARAVTAGTATQSENLAMQQQVVSAAQAYLAAQHALAEATIRADNAEAAQVGTTGLLIQTQREANLKLDEAAEAFKAGAIGASAYMSAEQSALKATQALHQAEAEAEANRSKSTETWAAVEVELAKAKTKLDDVTDAFNRQLASITEVISAENAYLKAQLAVVEQQAIAATGTVGLTDKVSLYKQEVAAAKAALEFLNQEAATGKVRAEDLLAANSKLESATKNLASAQDEAKGAVRDTTGAVIDQTAAVDDGSSTMDKFAASTRNARTEVQSLGSEIKALADDILDLGKDKGVAGSGSLGGAPAGYYYSVSDKAGGGYNVQLRPIPEGYEVGGPSGGIIPIPGYDWNKAKPSPTTGSSTSDSASGASSSAPYIPSGGQDTAASGGSYPGVVIHQAAGEVLLVALAAATSYQASAAGAVGGGDASGALVAATAATAATSTAAAVVSASGTMQLVVGELSMLTDIVGATVQQAAAIASKLSITSITGQGYSGNSVAGIPVGTPTTGQNTSGPSTILNNTNQGPYGTYNPYISNGMTPAAGAYSTGGTPGAGNYDYNYRAPTVPDPAAAGNTTPPIAVTVDMSGSTFGSQADANAIQQAVTDGLTRVLRDAGARY